ncbi:putative DNA binding CopG/RHH family protein [Pedobacter cryoconitis]|uniref:DUF3560 domain-containing protein n=1 Tax=Pedobacter cryoconitis TaxID=188932 RepID=UPI00161FAAA2|nr:DUF3560 domain-containing protein [Pedobacter cryoconitis]MBB6271835.1 putative DNA binding CopG/RHH family protein [Pedobacter cryoconitis]
MKHDFNERKERRISNAENRAAKNEHLSDELYNRAKQMASAIPFGQPILVGHHSERSDRRYRDKIHNTYGKAFEAIDKAKYYEDKAETIKSNSAIFSDDPDAIEKLTQKLQDLKQSQEFMKSANRYIKKGDKAGFLSMRLATVEMWTELTTPNVMGYIGFASFSLSNNNANIKRIEQRIKRLRRVETAPVLDKMIGGVRIFQNNAAGRLQMLFDGKPDKSIIVELKKHGFRWCRSEMAWQRHISRDAVYQAEQIAGLLG